MEIINLTKFDVTLITRNDGTKEVFKPSGTIAKCIIQKEGLLLENGFEVIHEQVKGVTGLPPEKPDTVYLVTKMVAMSAPDRRDLRIPGKIVKKDGEVIGAYGMVAVYNDNTIKGDKIY